MCPALCILGLPPVLGGAQEPTCTYRKQWWCFIPVPLAIQNMLPAHLGGGIKSSWVREPQGDKIGMPKFYPEPGQA